MPDQNYIVATIHDWNVNTFHARTPALPGNWHLIRTKDDLNRDLIDRLSPRYIFFPHWLWKVPTAILKAAECVCFHMTDVPYGRGGSPLQNLIARGHRETVLSALRMVEDMDAGPVYAKQPLSLAGRAQDIYERCAVLTFDMIADLIAREPKPVPQSGEVTLFQRRTPAQSRLPEAVEVEDLYDHIRMLDADGYPRAFIDHGNWRLELAEAHVNAAADRIDARVTIRKRSADDRPRER